MKIDAALLSSALAEVPAEARAIEGLGYDGLFTFEGAHDPFFPLTLAAEHTARVELATAIAIAFPRSPMHLANVGHDLQVYSKGRFVLGLGSQVKAHVEKRFSAAWDRPVARMRELIRAVRAIWRCWNEKEKLAFHGEFYRHTLMTPFFDPGPSPWGPPRIFLAGVGGAMTAVAGEVADGLFVHPLNSPEFIRGTTLPALERGFTRAGDGRSRRDFEISCQALLITGYTEEEMKQSEAGTKMQIAFYGSTPAYRCVLDTHGWGDLQGELNRLSKEGRWMEMAALIDEPMLDALTVRCAPKDVPARLAARYAGLVDRLSLVCHSRPEANHPGEWSDVVAAIRGIEAGPAPRP